MPIINQEETQLNAQYTQEYIERGLTDTHFLIRVAIAQLNIKFTPAQIERGIIDPNYTVRVAFASNLHFTPSNEQLMRWIDHGGEVAEALISREDVTLTDSQISNIFKKGDMFCLFALAMRNDFLPTVLQEKLILNHEHYWTLDDSETLLQERVTMWKSIREKNALSSTFVINHSTTTQSKTTCL